MATVKRFHLATAAHLYIVRDKHQRFVFHHDATAKCLFLHALLRLIFGIFIRFYFNRSHRATHSKDTLHVAQRLHDKLEMPRAHAKRKHKNQHESGQQHNQGRHIRDSPKQGDREVLQKELSKHAAIHRNRFFRHMRNVKVLERHEERQIHSQKRSANREAQQLWPKRGKRNEKPPKNQRGRKQDNRHTPKQERHEIWKSPTEIKAEPILFAANRNSDTSQQQDDTGQQHQIPHHHRYKIRIRLRGLLFLFNFGL